MQQFLDEIISSIGQFSSFMQLFNFSSWALPVVLIFACAVILLLISDNH